MKIVGKNGCAECFAQEIEDSALEEIKEICDSDLAIDSKIRIMPDVHAGKGCVVGTTMTYIDKICPNIVGVDIGCGMLAVELDDASNINLSEFDKIVHSVPSGTDIWDKSPFSDFDFESLRCLKNLENMQRLENSLGTLGGGNHFIELEKIKDDKIYLIIHSGSRNLGLQVANFYQDLASGSDYFGEKFKHEKENLIKKLRSEKRFLEIESALKELNKKQKENFEKIKIEKTGLEYLTDKNLSDYIHDADVCTAFAYISRENIANFILSSLHLKKKSSFHTIHNYVDSDKKIIRKGSISAKLGETVLIPLNMRDGSVLAVGKGNDEWNQSAPHGAGRKMSRKVARNSISLKDYQNAMSGIYSTSINKNTIDEAPDAYKNKESILNTINETVEIKEILKPIYNFKAGK